MLFLVLFVLMSAVFDRVSDAKVLFNDFKASFTLSEYFVVDANGCPYDGIVEPELQLENLPKNVIITQVNSILRIVLICPNFWYCIIKCAGCPINSASINHNFLTSLGADSID